MKTILLWLYIALFAALSAWSWLDPEPGVPPGELALDAGLSILTVLGMVFYATRMAAPRVLAAWKAIVVFLIVGHIVRLVLGWPELSAPDPELTVTEHRILLALTVAAGMAILLPAIVINVRFAQARHLRNRPATAA